jgi:chromate transporter
MLLKIFIVFFKVGLFSIGGAFSFLPVIEKEVVRNSGWLSRTEFLDITGMTQFLPGAISVKFATYTGYKMAGLPGIIAANLGIMLPPALFMFAAILFYMNFRGNPALSGAFKMIRIAVFSMIIAAAFQLIGFRTLADIKTIIAAAVFLFLFVKFRMHPAFILLGAGIIGALAK